MVIFIWLFTTVVFGVVYLFQILHLNLLGLQLIALLILYVSFRESKNNHYWRIFAMDVIMFFVVLILYHSHHTFTYINPNDVEKLILIILSIIIAQCVGIFWGRQFYKHNKKTD
ncbi:hypothetical protein GHI93_01565 [Lactococcus hircilactis]|uniref:Uncharacterized protein n=2 Tax=Lactococcus hircilactis TaxID=1494462 RepID=A0A7X1Z6U6_9LACT|nr:hypothetical protein [Lactococcus hircilactis]MQW38637.1 hypothetical protein [Lactococcus hircilactis]